MPDPKKKSLMDIFNENAQQEQPQAPVAPEAPPLSFGDRVRDTVDSVNSGIGTAVHETASFGIKAVETLVQGGERITRSATDAVGLTNEATPYLSDDILLPVEEWNRRTAEADGSNYKSKTVVGGVAQGVAQFVTGFVTVSNGMRAANILEQSGTMARSMIVGAGADAVAFDPHAERLSNLLEDFTDQHPSLRNDVTGFMAAKPDDSEAVGRLKNAMEGLVAGAALEKTLRALGSAKRYLYDSRLDKNKAAAKFTKEMTELAEEQRVSDANQAAIAKGEEVPKGFSDGEISGGVRDGADEVPKIEGEKVVDDLNPDDSVNFKTGAKPKPAAQLTADDAEALTQTIKNNPDWLEQGFVNIKDSGFNIAKSDTQDGAKLLLVDLMKFVTPTKKTLSEMKDDAVRYLGQDPKDVVDVILSGNVKAKDLASAIQAGKALTVTFVQANRQLARKAMAVAEGSPEHLAFKQEMLANLQRSTNLAAAVKELQGHGGRAVVQGRNKWITELSPDEMRAVGLADSNEAAMKLMQEKPLWVRAMNAQNQVWINSLLSNPITHARNVISNTINMVMLPAERMIGGVFSEGSMTREGADIAIGLAMSLKDSFKMAAKSLGIPQVYSGKGSRWTALKESGQSFLDPGNAKLSSSETKSPALSTANFKGLEGTNLGEVMNGFGQIANIPSRFLAAEDEFFKQINYRAHVMASASASGRELGLKGKDFSDYVARRLDESMDDQGSAKLYSDDGIYSLRDPEYDAALEYARRATFTTKAVGKEGDGLLDDIGNKFTSWLEQGTHNHPYLKLVMPFVRTPVNILKAAGIRSPGLNLLSKRYRDALTGKLGDRAAADARGQMATGAALWTGAITLAAEGKITGKGPADARERDALMQTGWQPYSVQVGDKYVSFQGFDPWATFFGLAADYTDTQAHLDDVTVGDITQGLLVAVANNTTSKSYLTGITQFAEAMTSPDKELESFLQSRIASYVPSGLKPIGQAVVGADPHMREVRSVMDAMMNRLPGFSQFLPPKRNVFGEAMTARTSVGPDVISPFFTTTVSPDKAKQELARLGHAFGAPSEKLNGVDLTQVKNPKGQDFYDRWQEKLTTYRRGRYTLKERLENLVTSSHYAKWRENEADALDATEEPRTLREVRAIISEYREGAKQELVRSNEFPGMTDVLKAKRQAAARADAGAPISPEIKSILNSFNLSTP
jgi:hypothetical protein